MSINIDDKDKKRLSPENTRSQRNAKQDWYAFRNEAIKKATGKTGQEEILKWILVVLVKIYWELRKPKQGE